MVLKVNIFEPEPSAVAQAVEVLKGGGLVALPTDTLYALTADISQESAVRKVFAAKRRPLSEPLPIGIREIEDIYELAEDVPPLALVVLKRYSPGPLTVVLKKKRIVSSLITGGREEVALRIPNSPVALEVIKRSQRFITLTSANLHKGKSPQTCEDVLSELEEGVDLILDGGKTPLGIESTIIDLTKKPPLLLREGAIKADALKEIIPDLVKK